MEKNRQETSSGVQKNWKNTLKTIEEIGTYEPIYSNLQHCVCLFCLYDKMVNTYSVEHEYVSNIWMHSLQLPMSLNEANISLMYVNCSALRALYALRLIFMLSVVFFPQIIFLCVQQTQSRSIFLMRSINLMRKGGRHDTSSAQLTFTFKCSVR